MLEETLRHLFKGTSSLKVQPVCLGGYISEDMDKLNLSTVLDVQTLRCADYLPADSTAKVAATMPGDVSEFRAACTPLGAVRA